MSALVVLIVVAAFLVAVAIAYWVIYETTGARWQKWREKR